MFSKRLNMAIVPSQKTIEYSLEVINQISSSINYEFVVNQHDAFAHITLYSCEFPNESRREIEAKFGELTNSKLSINISLGDIRINKRGFVLVDIKVSDEQKEFHIKTVEALNSLRKGILRSKYKSRKYREQLSTDELSNIDKYGHPHVLNLYKPHLTLGKLQNTNINDLDLSSYDFRSHSFDVNEFAIFEMAEFNGVCNKPLQYFSN